MKAVPIFLLAALAAGCVAADEPAELSAADRGELDAALAGRTAGPPIACVAQRDLRSNRTIGDGVILFEARNDTLYLNRTGGGCTLRIGRAFRTQTISSQLCTGDIITTFDPVSGAEFGGCGLGEFVPYRR